MAMLFPNFGYLSPLQQDLSGRVPLAPNQQNWQGQPDVLQGLGPNDQVYKSNFDFWKGSKWDKSKLGGFLNALPGMPQAIAQSYADMPAFTKDVWEGKVDPMSDEGYKRAMNMVLNLSLPAVGTGGAQAVKAGITGAVRDPNTLNLFGGPYAKTANIGQLNKAGSLYAKAGKGWDPSQGTIIPPQAIEDIFDKTGWFMGPDGVWRFKIPDVGAKFNRKNVPNVDEEIQRNFAKYSSMFPNMDLMEIMKYVKEKTPVAYGGNVSPVQEFLRNQGFDYMQAAMQPKLRLKDVIEHPELYAAYPDIAKHNTGFIVGPSMKRSGAYNTMTDDIFMQGPGMLSTMGTGLHEIQHAIQNREMMGSGGDYPIAQYAMDEVLKSHPGMDMPHVHDVYRALMGEAEARVPQDRWMKGPGQGKPEIRGTPYAAQGYDVLPSRQIDPQIIEDLRYATPGSPDYQHYIDILRQRLGALAGGTP